MDRRIVCSFLSAYVLAVLAGCTSSAPGDPIVTGAVDAGVAVEDPPPRTDAEGPMLAVAPDEEEPSEPHEPAEPLSCPKEMVLVEGRYCPDVMHVCKRWLDPPGRFRDFRCAEYAPSVCKSKKRKRLRFCIDRDEWTAPGDTLPTVNYSWTAARNQCQALGKRLCLESEWQFACEGEDMQPYPYGFVRDKNACNIDRDNIMGRTAPVDYRVPAASYPGCVSPFGVRDMSGNIEEWATIDGVATKGYRSTMKGAWWLPGRNHCRARTLGHGEIYFGPQIGVRCCKDPK